MRATMFSLRPSRPEHMKHLCYHPPRRNALHLRLCQPLRALAVFSVTNSGAKSRCWRERLSMTKTHAAMHAAASTHHPLTLGSNLRFLLSFSSFSFSPHSTDLKTLSDCRTKGSSGPCVRGDAALSPWGEERALRIESKHLMNKWLKRNPISWFPKCVLALDSGVAPLPSWFHMPFLFILSMLVCLFLSFSCCSLFPSFSFPFFLKKSRVISSFYLLLSFVIAFVVFFVFFFFFFFFQLYNLSFFSASSWVFFLLPLFFVFVWFFLHHFFYLSSSFFFFCCLLFFLPYSSAAATAAATVADFSRLSFSLDAVPQIYFFLNLFYFFHPCCGLCCQQTDHSFLPFVHQINAHSHPMIFCSPGGRAAVACVAGNLDLWAAFLDMVRSTAPAVNLDMCEQERALHWGSEDVSLVECGLLFLVRMILMILWAIKTLSVHTVVRNTKNSNKTTFIAFPPLKRNR
jgi:hypothetical protein